MKWYYLLQYEYEWIHDYLDQPLLPDLDVPIVPIVRLRSRL
jgi:hypothetical protein